MLDIEQELERLTQSTYPIEQLLQRPLPDGVDPTKLELYLSASHFKVSDSRVSSWLCSRVYFIRSHSHYSVRISGDTENDERGIRRASKLETD